jgi:thiol-disulfide isomerase/thioredoxin
VTRYLKKGILLNGKNKMDDITFNKKIGYLENDDFDNNGQLFNKILRAKKIPIVIMVQASWCHFCKISKPAFQDYADKTNSNEVFCATIHADGDRQSEKDLGERIKTIIPEFKGFPHYALYMNGVLVDKEIKGRTVEDLGEFTGVQASK